MNLHLQPINDEKIWENFLAKQQPASFLHSWAWGEFNQQMGTSTLRFGFYDGNQLAGVALVLKIKARRGSFFFCPHGPIFDNNLDKKDALALLVNNLKKEGNKEKAISFIRISPLLPLTTENNQIFQELNFREAPVHMMHPELGWILDTQPAEEELLKNMRKTTRYCIRKAEKDGVEIEVSSNPEDVEKFWTVYRATVDRQNFTPFTKEYLKNEVAIFNKNPESRTGASFFFAKFNGEIIATAIIVFYGNSAFYHHGASIPKYPKITAPYLLQWAVIKEAKRRGCSNYNFWGVVREDQNKHPWAGLSLFKRGFGGAPHEYVHAKDFVLNPKYWLNWSVEKARKWKRGL